MAVRGRPALRLGGLTLSVVLTLALSGAAGDGIWRGGGGSGLLAGDSESRAGSATLSLSDLLPRPGLKRCDWTRQPRPDDEIDIPDPEDYLILQDDGSYYLPSVTVEVGGHMLPLAELEDLMWVAADRGISVEEAIFRYSWQGQFSRIVTEVERAYPDMFAGAAIVDDGCGAWIAFKGAVPQRVPDLVQPVPVPVELIGDRGYAEAELVDVLETVYFRIHDHPDVINASGGPDSATGVITIYAQPRDSTTLADRVTLCEQLRPPSPANPAITIRVLLTEDLVRGGRTHAC
jgi:hypothetical protein